MTDTATTPTQPRPPAAAPTAPRGRVKARYVVALVVCAGAIAWMFAALKSNIDYWKPVTQAVQPAE